ncbi:hypothetical protein [Streptomyces bambusae]|uniref:Uncharacterized protein n=1 Tax=Streptomyces bambusae TaxID=1550616 RepID=A0ABS6ZAA8_9ACTN|nr:hypothetical protein [Streptomyces bambusae]MBW5484158.1 hypothetical protein [Streptomyces bambusae]
MSGLYDLYDVYDEELGKIPPDADFGRLANRYIDMSSDALVSGRPGGALPHLRCLAVGEIIRRRLAQERGSILRSAVRYGATWQEAAAALGADALTPADARAAVRAWADESRTRLLDDARAGTGPRVDVDAWYAGVMRLLDLADDERIPQD